MANIRSISKKIVILFLVFSLMIFFLPFLSSCSPIASFGNLVISSKIDPESAEPSDEKNIFIVTDESIFGTIEAKGVKADDIKRFNIKNTETGAILFNQSGPYSEDIDGYVEGYFYIESYKENDDPFLMEPGKYEISFFHNGELIDKAEFEVLPPESNILEVNIANEVDEETRAPKNITNSFDEDDIFYATIKLDFRIKGDFFEAKWSSEDEDDIMVNRIDIEEDMLFDNYIAFQLAYEEPWPAGNYSVEIYHNDNLEGIYTFEVIQTQEEVVQEEPEVYINESYGFGFVIPDGWELYEEEDGFLFLELIYIPGDVDVVVRLIVSAPEDAIAEEEYTDSALVLFSDNAFDDWTFVEEFSGEFVNDNNIYYEEYQQIFTDADGSEITMLVDFFKGSDKTYIMFSMVTEEYYETYNGVYEIIVGSFDFI